LHTQAIAVERECTRRRLREVGEPVFVVTAAVAIAVAPVKQQDFVLFVLFVLFFIKRALASKALIALRPILHVPARPAA
jgi:hypothetical protein